MPTVDDPLTTAGEIEASDAVPTPAPDAPLDDDRAHIGVLLVHGIGEQRQGETLSQFAEPLVEWIRDWLFHRLPPGSLVAAAPIRSRLKAPLLAPEEPAHAEVLIGAERNGREDTQRWLFAEAWWSAQVLVPSIPGFTSWLLTRGAWLLLFHLHQALLCAPGLKLGSVVVRSVLALVLWLPLSLLANMLLIVASLAAVIPLGTVRRAVYGALRAMTGVLGDSYVLIRNPIQREAFTETTVHAMNWLHARCRALAVVAHSQGAAVAHGALQRDGAPQASLLITVGAGITKLQALRHFELLPVSERVSASLAPPFLIAGLFVWLRVRQLALEDFVFQVAAPGFLALVGLSMLLVAWMSVRLALKGLRERSSRIALDRQQPGLAWLDLHASRDPVPGGPLTRYFDLPGVRSEEIGVLGSLLRDHTSYWGARATFLPRLVEELGHCARTTLFDLRADDPGLQRGRASHHRSLKLLTLSQWLDAVALLLPLTVDPRRLIENVDAMRRLVVQGRNTTDGEAPFSFIDHAMRSIERAVRWIADVTTGGQAAWAHDGVNWSVAALVLLLLLAGWKRIAFPMWQTWAGNRYDEALRARRDALAATSEPGASRPARAGQKVGNWLLDSLFATILFLPLITSLVWSFKPEWVGERQLYALLGGAAASLMMLFVALAVVMEWMEQFANLRLVHRVAHGGRGALRSALAQWPRLLLQAPRRLFPAFILLVAVALTFSEVLGENVAGFKDGVMRLFLPLFMLYLAANQLDELWQRLDGIGASVLRRRMAAGVPLVVFIGTAGSMAWHGLDASAAITSGSVLAWVALVAANAVHRKRSTSTPA